MRIRICVGLLLIFLAPRVQAAEVPFGPQQVISTAADGPRSVLAASSRSVLAASPSSDEDDDGPADLVETDTGVYVSSTDTGTDPFAWDTDGDGHDDGWELDLGSDPDDPDSLYPGQLPALGPCGRALLLFALAGSAPAG